MKKRSAQVDEVLPGLDKLPTAMHDLTCRHCQNRMRWDDDLESWKCRACGHHEYEEGSARVCHCLQCFRERQLKADPGP